jgi:NAD-dependent deacetylase
MHLPPMTPFDHAVHLPPMTPFDHAVRLLGAAARTGVLTGAGVSADSGIPTFRGRHDSLWARFDPMRLATAEAWREDAPLVWGWYRWRIALLAQALPNAGHAALAVLAQRCATTLLTQNVDDLHERAGSDVAAHLHGRIDALRCFACARPHTVPLPALAAAAVPQRLPPPRCVHCGGEVRPGVVWFGEGLPEAAWQCAAAAMDCDVLLVVGTSALVQPAASLPLLAQRRGARVIELNPEPTALTAQADLSLRGSAAQLLPALLAACDEQPGRR